MTQRYILASLLILLSSTLLQAQTLVYADGLGGSNYVSGAAVSHDGAGNAYLCGVYNGTADFDPGAGTSNLTPQGAVSDAYVAKYGPTGSLLWAVDIGGSMSSEAQAIAVTDAGDVYVTGKCNIDTDFDPSGGSTTLGTLAMFLAKYDANGQFQWAFPITNAWQENAFSLALAANGDVLVGGELNNPFDLDPSAGVATFGTNIGRVSMIARYSPAGGFVWALTTGLGTNATSAHTNGICTDATGNIFLTGLFHGVIDLDPSTNTANFTSSSPGVDDLYLAKYDDAGTYLWGLGAGDGSHTQHGVDVATASDGSVYLTGKFFGTVDMDPSAGTANIASTSYEGFLGKYSATGAFQWAFNMTNSGIGAEGLDVGVASNGDVFATGNTNFYAHFNPDNAAQSWNTFQFGQDAFVAAYTDAGSFVAAFLVGDAGHGIDMLPNGEYLITGNFIGTALDFDPGAGTALLTAHQAFSQDCYLVRYNGITGTTGLTDLVATPRIALYPEPTNGPVTLVVDDALMGATYELNDLSGRTFGQGTITAVITELRFDVPNGAYVITVTKNGAKATRRSTVVR